MIDHQLAAVVGVDDDLPDVSAVYVGSVQAAVPGVERVRVLFLEAHDVVEDFGHEVEPIVGIVPADGDPSNVQIRGVVGCEEFGVDLLVIVHVDEVMPGDQVPIGEISVHHRDLVVGELVGCEDDTFGDVGVGGADTAYEQNRDDNRHEQTPRAAVAESCGAA